MYGLKDRVFVGMICAFNRLFNWTWLSHVLCTLRHAFDRSGVGSLRELSVARFGARLPEPVPAGGRRFAIAGFFSTRERGSEMRLSE
jgi:hypothetical protein